MTIHSLTSSRQALRKVLKSRPHLLDTHLGRVCCDTIQALVPATRFTGFTMLTTKLLTHVQWITDFDRASVAKFKMIVCLPASDNTAGQRLVQALRQSWNSVSNTTGSGAHEAWPP